jgi:Uma2 family endonuclease
MHTRMSVDEYIAAGSQHRPPLEYFDMSLEEFREREFPRSVRSEWARGQAILMSRPNTWHQAIELRLTNAIGDAPVTARAFLEPELHMDAAMREPDIVVIERDLGYPDVVSTPPIIVAEILSRSTRTEDLLFKSVEYLNFGAQQYWIVEPDDEPTVEILANRGATWESIAKLTAKNPHVAIDVPGHGTVTLDHAEIFAR